jgi:hypothetical protein
VCTVDTCLSGTCQNTPILPPAKATWVATASSYYPVTSDCVIIAQTPSSAVDGSLFSRWTTGQEQAGNEWLQVDFGVPVVLNQVTLDTYDASSQCGSPTDYPRHYQVRVSDTPNDVAASVVAEGDGTSDLVVANFEPAVGRYLLISQTGVASPDWWAVAELDVACE